jgi:hypothetical protein
MGISSVRVRRRRAPPRVREASRPARSEPKRCGCPRGSVASGPFSSRSLLDVILAHFAPGGFAMMHRRAACSRLTRSLTYEHAGRQCGARIEPADDDITDRRTPREADAATRTRFVSTPGGRRTAAASCALTSRARHRRRAERGDLRPRGARLTGRHYHRHCPCGAEWIERRPAPKLYLPAISLRRRVITRRN